MLNILQIYYPFTTETLALMPFDIKLNLPKYLFNLISHIFVHISIVHLTMNMLFLYFFGTVLEDKIGSLKFLSVFMITGIVSGLTYTVISVIEQVNYGGVGTSGALLGIFGCLTIMFTEMNVYIFFMKIRIYIALIVMMIIYTMFISLENIVHITGILTGVFVGNILKTQVMEE